MSGVCERTLGNLVDHIGSSLNDLEGTELYRLAIKQGIASPVQDDSVNHVRWSEQFLTSVINDSFRILNLERPDLFIENVRFKLQPGCADQPLPDDCMRFGGKLVNSSNCDKRVIPNLMSMGQLDSSNRVSGLFCQKIKPSNYQVQSYGFYPKNPGIIGVSPLVPEGADAYVTISCVGKQPCYDWPQDKDELIGKGYDQIIDLYEPMFVEYALYRAYSSDHEAESSKEVAKLHWERAFEYIKEGRVSDYFFYHPDLYLSGQIKEGTGRDSLRTK